MLIIDTILHITKRKQWEQAKLAGIYQSESFEYEGFIHCSTPQQITRVANYLFANQTGLVLLFIDAEKVTAEIRYETAEVDGELFPHIYGALNIEAVFKVIDFEPNQDGLFQLPKGV
jgi:uncharacterized protein (DUF952 family)